MIIQSLSRVEDDAVSSQFPFFWADIINFVCQLIRGQDWIIRRKEGKLMSEFTGYCAEGGGFITQAFKLTPQVRSMTSFF